MDDGYLSVTVELDRATVVVRPSGEIDLTTAGALRDALAVQLARSPARLVVDLADTAFCDCAGVRVLVDAARVAAAAGVELAVRRPRPLVARVLRLTQADELLGTAD